MINTQVVEDRPAPFESINRNEVDMVSQDNQEISDIPNVFQPIISGKRRLMEVDSERGERDSVMIDLKPQKESFERAVDFGKNLLRNNQNSQQQEAALIRTRIMKRDKEFKKCNPLEIKDKPTNAETMAYLTNLLNQNQGGGLGGMGSQRKVIPKYAKTSLRQCGAPKPCFHPNGGMLFVKGKKIQVIPTKKIDPDVQKSYQPSKILSDDSHMRIEDEKLDEHFSVLNLREQEGMIATVKLSLEDRKLFEAKLPTVTMMLSRQE